MGPSEQVRSRINCLDLAWFEQKLVGSQLVRGKVGQSGSQLGRACFYHTPDSVTLGEGVGGGERGGGERERNRERERERKRDTEREREIERERETERDRERVRDEMRN